MRLAIVAALIGLAVLTGRASAQPREEKVRADRKKVEAEGFWIYNDLAKGIAVAKQTHKPLLVVLRCIPCEECVKLDDELVNQDPRVRPLLQQFVCVRLISTNGLALALFQFDYDQSFAAFLLNADGTIYGRFGTRSHRTEWSTDVSIDGLAQALTGALELHRDYPKNRAELRAKTGPPPAIAAPELYPALKDKYSSELNYAGKVVPSCIHCHQIGDAQREFVRRRHEPLPEDLLFPFPHPKSIGLILDPKERALVARIDSNSPAARAGFARGDRLIKLDGQPLLSIADVQWVLHRADGAGAELKAQVQRGEQAVNLTLSLPNGWRERDDLSWRASTWGLRRMATGGLLLATIPDAERESAGITSGHMALRVKHVGQYGAHAAAKNAGFRQGDIVIAFAGRNDLHRESDLIAYAVRKFKPGDRAAVTVLRDRNKVELKLPMQE